MADGCCTACGVPVSTAPELFGWDEHDHCFVKRQPSTSSETDKALRSVRRAELECIRYRGADPDILARFAELGVPHLCDFGGRFDLRPVLRNQATFALNEADAVTPERLAEQFQDYLLKAGPNRNRVTPVVVDDNSASFSFAWYEDQFHRVIFCPADERDSCWLVRHEGNLGVSDWLHEWLAEDRAVVGIRWFADTDRSRSKPWRATPW